MADNAATKEPSVQSHYGANGQQTALEGLEKMIYFFSPTETEGDPSQKDLLGGKGAGLAGMARAGLPVPPGFTITTAQCILFYAQEQQIADQLLGAVKASIHRLENEVNRNFGSAYKPLLLSVRSGAKFSMPGMMDTILNLGLNEQTLLALIDETGDARFAYDAYRRFIAMFGNVVLGISKEHFENIIDKHKQNSGIEEDAQLSAEQLKEISIAFKELIHKLNGSHFPEDPWQQLQLAIEAVFKSWHNKRAVTYRMLNDIPDNLGTAVTVQTMVFGNMGSDSATGVGFTRNPSTGKREFFGEFLLNAQGEDVVAGTRTPEPISGLKELMPDVYDQLCTITLRLETFYRDMQDFEFTIEKGKLYMLQTRTGKRSAVAAVKCAVDMVEEKLITKEEAISRIHPVELEKLLHPHLDPTVDATPLAKGLAASPGAAAGKVVFHSQDAVSMAEEGEVVILVRPETNPDDIRGMASAVGILTTRGGMTSHAAVVARGMGKVCVAGAETLRVDEKNKTFTAGGVTVAEGELITIDGTSGTVFLGSVATIEPELSSEFSTLLSWADQMRTLGVRANADSPHDAALAIKFGAEGIGLCRTEHMFFAPDRLQYVQQMILADNSEERMAALNNLLPFQREDFRSIFSAMAGLPVTIRTLDPPLHEFLPVKDEIKEKIAALQLAEESSSNVNLLELRQQIAEKEKVLQRIEQLAEVNPMLGQRGCRLGIVYPEITAMQAQAIFLAACDMVEQGVDVHPEIMVPLVGTVEELRHQRNIIDEVAEDLFKKRKQRVDYKVGTMIEIPRAALLADEIAAAADFFSFGTNDLTQMTLGLSRDDASKFLGLYLEKGIYSHDPFTSIDERGVGKLILMATEGGRKVNPKLTVGICGEHGGDPRSIAFCNTSQLSYVSCSPYRVPIARLAAAQSACEREADGGTR